MRGVSVFVCVGYPISGGIWALEKVGIVSSKI